MITVGEKSPWNDRDDERVESAEKIGQHRQFILELAERVHAWYGELVLLNVEEIDQGSLLTIEPKRLGSASVWVVAAEWIDLQIGDTNCRFTFCYTDDNITLVQEILRGVAAGEATEIRGPGRSLITVMIDGNTVQTYPGTESLFLALLPVPGWRSWGTRTVFPAYSL